MPQFIDIIGHKSDAILSKGGSVMPDCANWIQIRVTGNKKGKT